MLAACALATLCMCYAIALMMCGNQHQARALENAYHPFSVETSVRDR